MTFHYNSKNYNILQKKSQQSLNHINNILKGDNDNLIVFNLHNTNLLYKMRLFNSNLMMAATKDTCNLFLRRSLQTLQSQLCTEWVLRQEQQALDEITLDRREPQKLENSILLQPTTNRA